jgi:hypothetical protein
VKHRALVSDHAVLRLRERCPAAAGRTDGELRDVIVRLVDEGSAWGAAKGRDEHVLVHFEGLDLVLALTRTRNGARNVTTVLTLDQAVANQHMVFGRRRRRA